MSSIFFVLSVVGVSSPDLWMTAGVERPPNLLMAVPPWSFSVCGMGVLLVFVWVFQGRICWHHRSVLGVLLLLLSVSFIRVVDLW